MRARANLFTRGLSYTDSNFIYHVYARKPVMKFTPVRTLNLRDSGNRLLGAASGKAMVTCR